MIRPIIRPLAILLSTLLPLPAIALCNGPGFTEYLSTTDIAELDQTVANTPYGSGLYWRANKDNAQIHILGTMHLPDPRHDALLNMARPQLEAADLLLVEATQEDQTAMQVYMANNPDITTITSGPTLLEALDPQTWTAVQEAAAARGLPGFIAAKMQPWFLSMTLSFPPCAMAAMAGGDLGLDAMLMEVASDAGVPIAPLEAWQNMFALLSTGTFEEQVDALRLGLLPSDLQDALMVDLANSYFNQETAFGWHLAYYSANFLPGLDMAEFEVQMAEFEQMLLIDRNRAWIPVIEGAATTHNNVFIGFGAAHLIGEEGVLNLLVQNGWTVTPL